MNETILQAMKIIKPTPSGPQAQTEAADGSSRTFDELFLEYWPRVYRWLERLVGDPAEAEDLALETFLRVHQQLPALDQLLNPGGWLHRVAINLGLHSIRSFKRYVRKLSVMY